jgi:hypothetical protein
MGLDSGSGAPVQSRDLSAAARLRVSKAFALFVTASCDLDGRPAVISSPATGLATKWRLLEENANPEGAAQSAQM